MATPFHRNRLRALRRERELSQESLAARMGMPRDRLTRIEREVTHATPEERDRFVVVLNRFGLRHDLKLITADDLQLRVDPRGATRGVRPRALRGRHGVRRLAVAG